MKHYFKYASGYINIDSENLFMTNSGNWQETHELQEKSNKTAASNNGRVFRMKAYVYTSFGLIGIFIAGLFTRNTDPTIGTFIVLGLLGILAYFLFEYFKRDFGKRYKIPLAKITAIEPYEKGLRLHFLNAAGQPDMEVLDNVEPKGFELLRQLELLQTGNIKSE